MRLSLTAVLYHSIVARAIHARSDASFSSFSYPQDPEIGQTYNISWEGGSAPFNLYLVGTGAVYPHWNGSASQMSWSPTSDICTNCSLNWLLEDDSPNDDVESMPFEIRSAGTGTSTVTRTSTIAVTFTASSTNISSTVIPTMSVTSSLTTATTSIISDITVETSAEMAVQTIASSQPSQSSSSYTGPVVLHTPLELNKGAIAGISVGSAGFIVLVVIAILICRKRRLRHGTAGADAESKTSDHELQKRQHPPNSGELEKCQSAVAEACNSVTVIARPAVFYELSAEPSTRSFELPASKD